MVAVHHDNTDTLDRVEAARLADPHNAANHPARVTAAIESVHPSPTNPRKRFPEASIRELADTIATYGLMSPPLVRPHPTIEGEYELVAGERRLRAVRLLGWQTLPVIVRDLSDGAVTCMQLIENGQREGVHPLEEAEAIRRVLETPSEDGRFYSVADVADMIGKSVSYIDKRLKLLELCEPAREAFLDGARLSAGVALAIARLTPDAQVACMAELAKHDGEITTRDAQEWIRKHVLLRLADAPFPLADATLGGEGACNGCTHRTSNMLTLFDGETDDDCLKPACYRVKDAAHWERRAAEARTDGLAVIDETETDRANFDYVKGGNATKNRWVRATSYEESIDALAADNDVKPAALYRLRTTGKIEYAYNEEDLRPHFPRATTKAPAPAAATDSADLPGPVRDAGDDRAREEQAARVAETRAQEIAAREVVAECVGWLGESLSPHAALAARIAIAPGVGLIEGVDVPEGTESVAAALEWVGGLSAEAARSMVVKFLVDDAPYRLDVDDARARLAALRAAHTKLDAPKISAKAPPKAKPKEWPLVAPEGMNAPATRATTSQGEVLLERAEKAAAKGKATKATPKPATKAVSTAKPTAKPSPKSKTPAKAVKAAGKGKAKK